MIGDQGNGYRSPLGVLVAEEKIGLITGPLDAHIVVTGFHLEE